MRSFVGIDLGVEGATDEATVCKFRHLLERNKLPKTLLTAVNNHLHRSGIKITKGTIVNATIIGDPGSTNSAYGAKRLEAACTRTLTHASPFDRTVKSILAGGNDLQPLATHRSDRGFVYGRDVRFHHDAQTLFQSDADEGARH